VRRHHCCRPRSKFTIEQKTQRLPISANAQVSATKKQPQAPTQTANNDKPAAQPQQGNKAQDDTVNKWGSAPRFCIESQIIRHGNGERFRRNNAPSAKLGSYGGQESCVLCSSAPFTRKGVPKDDWIIPGKIEKVHTFEVDAGSQSSLNVDGQVTAAKEAGVQAGAGINTRSSRTESIKAEVWRFKDMYQLTADLNSDQTVVKRLAALARPRIVFEVMVLTADSTAGNADCAGGTANVAGTGVGSVAASGSACDNAVSIVKGDTIIGYTLVEPKWKEGKTEIMDLDYAHACHHMNVACQCQAWR
jgi:hypothetical protein